MRQFYSVGFHWIRGAMLGLEFITRDENEGVATVVFDLLILRVTFQHWEEEEEDE